MSLDKALNEAMNNVPECLAGAYVDMSTGMLLAVRTLDSHPQEALDLVAAATADMFQGKTIIEIEDHFFRSRGGKGEAPHYFEEFLVFSLNLIHVFMRSKKHPEHVVTFVCRKSANVGMVLTRARGQVEKLEALV